MSKFTWLLLGLAVGWFFGRNLDDWLPPSAAEEGRRYVAYRACIQRSDCKMTSQDWIDYYELKWQLEEKPIEQKR